MGERQLLIVKQFGVKNGEGILSVVKSDTAVVGASDFLAFRLFNRYHLGILAEELRHAQCSKAFNSFKLVLMTVGTESIETDGEGLKDLANFLASHLTVEMVEELSDKLLRY